MKAERYTLQRHVKNADEDLKLALDVVDSKDDEATADDRLVCVCVCALICLCTCAHLHV